MSIDLESVDKNARSRNLRFHLWLGDWPIHDTKTGVLIGFYRPDHVTEFCKLCWAEGESPLQRWNKKMEAKNA